MKNKKALGLDGIPAEVYKLVLQHLDLLLNAFNACLKKDSFPSCWKVKRLDLISKYADGFAALVAGRTVEQQT